MENKLKLKALNTIVIVEEVLLENKTDFGFDLSNVIDVNETQRKGIVRSIGELCPKISNLSKNKYLFIRFLINLFKKDVFTLKEGDEVLFNKHKNTPITIDGVKYIMIEYRDMYIRL